MKSIDYCEEIIKQNFLFKTASPESLEQISTKGIIQKFISGAQIETPGKALGVLLSGKASVEKNGLIMRFLEAGDLFGIATLFIDNISSVSLIRAKGNVQCLFIEEKLLLMLLKNDFAIVENYIFFQADRICYLNKLIEEYTGNNTKAKLAAFLYHTAIEQNSLSPSLTYNMSQLAKALNMGRASLYRSLAQLKLEKIIIHNENEIKILDLERLSKIIKNEEF